MRIPNNLAILKKTLWQWRGVAIAPAVAGVIVGLRALGLLQPLELAALDQFFRWRPLGAVDDRMVVVGINETDIQTIKQWPLSDRLLAKALTKIKQQHPVVIGLDLYRDFPVEPGHQDLVQVFKTTPNLIGIRKVVGDRLGVAINPPPILAQLHQVATNDLVIDYDGKIRRNLLTVADPSAPSELVPTLGAMTALIYLNTKGISLEVLDADNSEMRLGLMTLTALQTNDGGYVGADVGGYQTIANFRGLHAGFHTVSLMDVLNERIPKDLFRDRIVMIGVVAESAADFFSTALTNGQDPNNPRTAGVFIHTDVASQLLAMALDDYPLIRVWPKWMEGVWILAWALVGSGVCWLNRYRNTTDASWAHPLAKLPLTFGGLVVVSLGLVGGSYSALLSGWWLPMVPSVLGLTGAAIATTAYTARSLANMRNLFSRYLTDAVVTNLLERPGGFDLGGERVQVTILMSDLRGFSAISEQLSTEKAVILIDAYLATITEVINQYQGTINEFIGDGVMVMFGAPIQAEDDAQRAVACAIAMQLAMVEVNQRHHQLGLPPLEMGIGINTGEVFAGNIGSSKRAKYTIIGSPVNLASRIESYTVGGQVLISQATYDQVAADLRIDDQLVVHLKGMRQPTRIYQVGAIGHPFHLALPVPVVAMVLLKRPITVEYWVIVDKQLDGVGFPGQLVQVSASGAVLRSPYTLERLSNIRIALLTGGEKTIGLGDLYAKVMARSPTEDPDSWSYSLRFTAIPPEVAALLRYLQDL